MLEEGVETMVQRVRSAAKIERLDTPAAPAPAGTLLDNAAPPPSPPPSGGGGGRGPAQQQQRR
jgi:hypothetical protein